MKIQRLLMGAMASVVTLFPTPSHARYGCWGGVPHLGFSSGDTYINLTPSYKTDQYFGSTPSGSITLYGSVCAENSTYQRQGWTWWNGDVSYTVYWRPSDPHFARLVVKRGGTTLVNKLLQIDHG